jgi:hypothetical protein
MANQMVALQARAPQGGGLGPAIAQGAQMINMMTQQRAAERQAAQAQQAMDIQAAQEARAAAKAVPEMKEAEAKAGAAQVKYVMDFMDASELAIANVRDPQQARAVGNRLKQMFPEPEFQQSIDETLGSLPQDPAQFEAWREQALFLTMDAKDQLAQEFETLTTGTEQYMVGIPKNKPGAAATEIAGTRVEAPQGIQYIKGDDGSIYAVPKTTAGAPSGRGNSADVVYGFGQFAQPPKPISSMTIGEVQNFQKNELIPATRGKIGAGPDKGTGAVGTYQIVYGTLKDYAPKVLGPNWRNTPFTADVQDRIAKAIYEDVKNGNLKDTWAGLPANRPGAYSNVPWEQVRDQIAAVESGGTRGAAAGGPTPVITGTGGKAKPSTEGERRFGTISRQMRTNLKEAINILDKNPEAIRPTGLEYAASQIPVYGEEARLFAESEPRQQFVATILRFLDNITFVNTGAGTSKEQEANYRRSYIPTYQDTNTSAYRKLVAMVDFARNVKDAAGVMWTPELDADFNMLSKAVEKLKPKAKAKPAAAPRATPTRSSIPKDVADKYGL